MGLENKRPGYDKGVAQRVADAVSRGASSMEEIRRVAGVTSAQIGNARYALGHRGIVVPRVNFDSRVVRDRLRDPHLSIEEGKNIMHQVSDSFCIRHTRGEDALFIAVRSFFRQEVSIHNGRDLQSFREILMQAEIPLRTISQEIRHGPQKGIRSVTVFPAVFIDRARTAIQTAFTSVGGDR